MIQSSARTNRLATHLQLRIKRLDHKRESLRAQTTRVHDARLWTAALLLVGLVASAIWKDLGLALPILVAGAIAFAWLLRRDLRLTKHTRDIQALHDFDARQSARLRGEPPPGVEAVSTLGLDINLTGSHSLFTLLDETFSTAGRNRLLGWITGAPDLKNVDEVKLRQTQIKDLARHVRFLKRLRLKAAASSELRIATSESARQLESFAALTLPLWTVAVAGLIWVAWICVLLPFIFGVTSFGLWSGSLLLGFAAFHSWARRETGSVFMAGEGLTHHLDALSPLFAHIESSAGVGSEAEKLTTRIRQHQPAKVAKSLSRWLSLLSVEGNPIVHIVLMILTPWQLVATYGFLRKTQQLRAIFHPCVEELTELEAISSLVFFYVYQTQVFPDLKDEGFKCEGLYHPLLHREKAVANTFEFRGRERLGLITGSNMAGKSTFLRTLGINQVLSLMGAPVFASNMTTGFYRVETCIQVTDSLRDGFSYFFAEVQRLRHLITAAEKSQPPVLYLIDEIFRGTNNRERRIGSRAVIESLAKTSGLGFISTHDLELTEIADQAEMSGRIRNLHFRDDLDAGTMVFHYKIHEGPCPSTNALTIMRQAGLGPFVES